jgi:dihydroxyacid dehydratase/phosphogluconate dehydratase
MVPREKPLAPFKRRGFIFFTQNEKEVSIMHSNIIKKGSTRAAHRSLFYAMGYSEEDLEKPLIGIVNSFNEIIPGHGNLTEIA